MAGPACARFLLQRSTHGLLLSSRKVPAFSSPFLSRAHRLSPSDDEMYQRTSVSIMQKDPDNGIMIHSYSPRGFNIDGNQVFGPCAVLPPAILQWNPNACATFNFLTSERRVAAAGLIPPPVSTALDVTQE
ncbi:NADH dehydrogenase [ubiquinone] 1 alpha subcomplex assembly factor 3 [Nibea albiflora]|uniref:NADH dehydrogenase [ubiquinone] 1 alpha subcomplex assembly factor 3 n=1 Tax=Nibea albiflora TaxID=240163 RepID=A0ACB7EZV9_NIBAL|nr:NADH dehydrogenase [ubiquinone] 1 alpha subcomplex assembly factor 3 [Nibea albiflora]